MKTETRKVASYGFRFSIYDAGKERGRAYLYIMKNDLHDRPFGFLEDVFVDEAVRGQGIGSRLLREVISTAKKEKCYKLIATSRFGREHVHNWYEKSGFVDYGKEFRMNFDE